MVVIVVVTCGGFQVFGVVFIVIVIVIFYFTFIFVCFYVKE